MKVNQKSTNVRINQVFVSVFASILLVFVAIMCSCTSQNSQEPTQTISAEHLGLKHNDNYQLEQMTVLSRHNIRSPLTNSDSAVAKNCSHEWHNWSSKPGELSLLGGQCETVMGQYFRKYLEQEKLIPENWIPQNNEALFYSNSYQRTIATAEYFSTGMLPVANTQVQYQGELGSANYTFLPKAYNVTPEIKAKVEDEVNQLFDGNYKDLKNKLHDNMKLIQDIIGYKGEGDISDKDVLLVFEEGKSVSSKGFVQDLTPYSDALAMQYCEESDNIKAAFGKNLSFDEWKKVGAILDAGLLLACGSNTEAKHSINPMLVEFKKNMDDPNRKFTFLCGHDSTLTPFLSALDVKWENLPYTITPVSPIGGKVVFSKFKNAAGEEFVQVNYVYESSDQIRQHAQLDLDNPPVSYPLEFNGLEKNADGYYKLADIENRFNESIAGK